MDYDQSCLSVYEQELNSDFDRNWWKGTKVGHGSQKKWCLNFGVEGQGH